MASKAVLLQSPDSSVLLHPVRRMSERSERNCLITDVILDDPINQDVLDTHKTSRRAGKAACFVISASAKLPYIPIALTLPGGPFLAFANSSAFLALEYWAIEGTLDDFLGPKSGREVVLLERGQKGRYYVIATLTTAVAFSLISQIPIALPALDYDGAYGGLGFSVLMIAGSLLPIRSIQLSIDKSLQLQCLRGEVGKKVELVRSDMLTLIDDHREIFKQMVYLEQIAVLSKMTEIRQGSVVNKVDAYARLIFIRPLNSPIPKETSLCDRVSSFAGLLITSTFQVALTMYTWSKTKEHIADNNFAAGVFAGLVLGTGIYLTGKSIIQTTQRMTRSIVDFFRCRQQRTIAEQVNPSLCFSLKTIGLVIDLAALGPTIRIWGDFFNENPATQVFMEASMCAAIFLLLSTATLQLAERIVEDIASSGKNQNKKEIVQYHRGLERFTKVLQESPLLDFSIFVTKCPEEIKTQLLERAELATEALQGFINAPRELESINDVENDS